ncbi:MFS transporter [Lentibacillus sp. L22]|uniref:MFS transporter n=1 Tax=Lentibacillus sp. L22 TaxID=3163028 RepID=UPI0034655DB6
MNKEKASKIYQPRKINIFRAIGFGLPDVMGGGAFTIIGAWLLFFWTTYAGLTAVEAASILGIARVVDAFISLFMGSISDNFYRTAIGKKFGRRHFFLLIGSPLMLVFILMWITGMGYWYYLISYLLFEIVAGMVLIPWETLPTEMTEDYTKRTLFSTTRMFISSSGVFLATFVPGQLFKFFGENSAAPFLYNAIFFAVIYVICVFIAYKSTWERQITPEIEANLRKTASSGLWETLKKQCKDYFSTLRLKSFRKHLIIYLLNFRSPN